MSEGFQHLPTKYPWMWLCPWMCGGEFGADPYEAGGFDEKICPECGRPVQLCYDGLDDEGEHVYHTEKVPSMSAYHATDRPTKGPNPNRRSTQLQRDRDKKQRQNIRRTARRVLGAERLIEFENRVRMGTKLGQLDPKYLEACLHEVLGRPLTGFLTRMVEKHRRGRT